MSPTPPATRRIVDYRLPLPILVPELKGDCSGMPTDWWFPPPHQSGEVLTNMRAAIAICNGCPIKQKCLEFALDNPSIQGIWGATSPRARNNLRAVMRRKAAKAK